MNRGRPTIDARLGTPRTRPPGPPQSWTVREPQGVQRRSPGIADPLGPRVRRPRRRPGSARDRSCSRTTRTWSRRSWSTRIASSSSTTDCGRRSGPSAKGLLTSEGEFWRSQRKLAQPAFHRERIAAFGRTHGRLHRANARLVGRRPGPRRPGRHDAADPGDRRQDALRRRDRRRVGRRQRGDGDADAQLHRQHRRARSSRRRWFPTPMNLRVARTDPPAGADPLRDHRRAASERRGPWRPALDAAPGPGRGERPADDRPAAPRRSDDPVHGRPRDHGQYPGLGLVPALRPSRGRGPAPRRARPRPRRPPADGRRLAPAEIHREHRQRDAPTLSPRLDARPRGDRAARAGRISRSREGRPYS